MLRGEVRHIYGICARPSHHDMAAPIATEYLWLRAGNGGQSADSIERQLSPYGIDAYGFIDAFDRRSAAFAGAIVPVVVRIFGDGSYDFEFGRISRVGPPLKPEAMDPYRHS